MERELNDFDWAIFMCAKASGEHRENLLHRDRVDAAPKNNQRNNFILPNAVPNENKYESFASSPPSP